MTPEKDVPASIVEPQNDSPAALEAWVKPEVISFVPASEAHGPPSTGGIDGFSNLS